MSSRQACDVARCETATAPAAAAARPRSLGAARPGSGSTSGPGWPLTRPSDPQRSVRLPGLDSLLDPGCSDRDPRPRAGSRFRRLADGRRHAAQPGVLEPDLAPQVLQPLRLIVAALLSRRLGS